MENLLLTQYSLVGSAGIALYVSQELLSGLAKYGNSGMNASAAIAFSALEFMEEHSLPIRHCYIYDNKVTSGMKLHGSSRKRLKRKRRITRCFK